MLSHTLTNTNWMVPALTDFSVPQVWFYRNVFTSHAPATLEFDFSADEYAIIFLDGQRIGEGPERGTDVYWFYNHLAVQVGAGMHTLVFCVNSFGPIRPMAQLTIAPGLWVQETSNLLATNWECAPMAGCVFFGPQPDWCGSPRAIVGPGYDYAHYLGQGTGWRPVATRSDSRVLHEPMLPAMRYEPEEVQHAEGDTLWRFKQYFVGWGHYTFTGSGIVRIRWFEKFDPDYGSTDNFPGLYEDIIQVDGPTEWRDVWFHAGNCVSIKCGCNIKVEADFHRTGYPWHWDVSLDVPDPHQNRLLHLAEHTLRCCTRDTFMDCPFYEQMQYVADTRLEALTLLSMTNDSRLYRKAALLLSHGIYDNGLMRDRYPDRLNPFNPDGTVKTVGSIVIPSFALLYVQMVHDVARFHLDDDLVRSLLPKLRQIFNYVSQYTSKDGVLEYIPGWNYIDWHPCWKGGTPDNAKEGGCTLNWIYVESLKNMADLERHLGSAEAAAQYEKLAEQKQQAIERIFFDKTRGLFSEDRQHTCFSEHAQVFAVIAGNRTDVLPALEQEDLVECGICFSFYYLEVCRKFGLKNAFDKRIKKYFDLAEREEITALPEEFKSWRSWCHAWSANYPYFCFSHSSIFDKI